MNHTPEPSASARTLTAPQALLDTNESAGNGNPAESQTPEIPPNAIFHGECGKWWTGTERSHASCCHETFASLTAFERHRKGLRCNPPESVGLERRDKPYGVLWGNPAPAGGFAGIFTKDQNGATDA